jgi:predicted nucleic acid-binding protein
MVTYILDSSAILRYLHNQAGSDRIAEIIRGHLAGGCEVVISALHWGEIAGITCELYGHRETDAVLSRLSALGLRVIAADGDRALRSALIKVETGIPYVDSFGVELAKALNGVLVTADFDFKRASREVNIEFLATK